MARPSLSSMRRPKSGDTPRGDVPRTTGGGKAEKKDEHAMTLRMPKALSKALKMKAIDEDSNVTAIILRAVERELGRTC